MKEITFGKKLLLGLILILIFVLVHSPHHSYPLPLHVDEWHHIAQARHLGTAEYGNGLSRTEIGFHLFLAAIDTVVDIIEVYHLLPATWAVLGALVLFWITLRLAKDYWTALFAAIFFASLKSNANILGLWLYTPLTFAIPWVYGYVYLFTVGLDQKNIRMLIVGSLLFLLLLVIHPISSLFAIPFLTLLFLVNWKKTRELKRGAWIVPALLIVGVLAYKMLVGVSWAAIAPALAGQLVFERGWGMAELNNSLFEVYSLVGFLLALLGSAVVLFRKQFAALQAFVLWAFCLLLIILCFKITGYSLLSPFQRNLYYFGLVLPLLSAVGMVALLKATRQMIEHSLPQPSKRVVVAAASLAIVALVITMAFASYWSVPEDRKISPLIDEGDYSLYAMMDRYPAGKIMAPLEEGTVLYAATHHLPVATVNFKGNSALVTKFYRETNCTQRLQMIEKETIKYVLTKQKESCFGTELFHTGSYVYDVG